MPEAQPHKRFVVVILNAWCVFLGVSANNRPEFLPLRIFFILLALYGLNVTTIYTSFLITVFTHPSHEQQIDSIDDIIEAGLPLGGREDYEDWFINDNPLDAIVDRLYQFTENFEPSDTNVARVRDGLQAMLMNRFYVMSNRLRDTVYAVSGNVFSNPFEMIAERGFPLMAKFNRLINYMKDAGLINKIQLDFVYNMTVLEQIRHSDDRQDDSAIVLTIEHLEGAFAVLIVGSLLSLVVFGLELISVMKWWCKWRALSGKWVHEMGTMILVRLKLLEPPSPMKPVRQIKKIYR